MGIRHVRTLIAVALLALPVFGHEIGTTQVDVAFHRDHTYSIDVISGPQTTLNKLERAAGESRSRNLTDSQLADQLRAHGSQFLGFVDIRFNGRGFRPRLTVIQQPLRVIMRLTGDIPAGATTFTWRYALASGSYALAVDGSRVWLDADATSAPFALSREVQPPTRLEIIRQYLVLGFTHILPNGIDHILFVLGMFLLTARLKDVLAQVTAFTVAHSITLGLTMYGLVTVSPRIVEPAIALSIAYVAIENVMTSHFETVARRHRFLLRTPSRDGIRGRAQRAWTSAFRIPAGARLVQRRRRSGAANCHRHCIRAVRVLVAGEAVVPAALRGAGVAADRRDRPVLDRPTCDVMSGVKFARIIAVCLTLLTSERLCAGIIQGTARDTSGQPLPGVTVEVTRPGQPAVISVTDRSGLYKVEVQPGVYQVSFRLINFAGVRRTVTSRDETLAVVDATLPLETSASIVVTGKKTFRNLADLDTPINGMIGVADAASVGVITAKQIENRSEQRPGEVLETVPGVVISQHSGEGKANQYYLRGFNLDHGTDFATTVAGAPVNMPTHAHGQGYSDNNFLIPELISGIQYKKGPYYADEGDFSSAGAANVNYVNVLDRPIASVTGGSFGYMRAFAAGSTALGGGQLLGGLELSRNNGPWKRPDDYHKFNGLLRFTGGSDNQAYSLTAAAYDGRWNSSDQIPDRAVSEGLISRFGSIDSSDGGQSHRYSLGTDWQRSGDNSLVKANAYVIGYGLRLFSDFTYFLDDPINGDQFEQADRRIVVGGRTATVVLESVRALVGKSDRSRRASRSHRQYRSLPYARPGSDRHHPSRQGVSNERWGVRADHDATVRQIAHCRRSPCR